MTVALCSISDERMVVISIQVNEFEISNRAFSSFRVCTVSGVVQNVLQYWDFGYGLVIIDTLVKIFMVMFFSQPVLVSTNFRVTNSSSGIEDSLPCPFCKHGKTYAIYLPFMSKVNQNQVSNLSRLLSILFTEKIYALFQLE